MIIAAAILAAAPLKDPAVQRLFDGVNQYQVSGNANGVVLASRHIIIYLGKKCDAYSPLFGRGHWNWANGGLLVELEKRTFGFARQDSPFRDFRCQFH